MSNDFLPEKIEKPESLVIPENYGSKVVGILKQYDDTEFSEDIFKACNTTVPNDFSGQRIRNGEYEKCEFNGNSFKFVGAAGTQFIDCKLIACDINGANMQFCNFSKSEICNNTSDTHLIQGTNFNQSCFYKTHFQNVSVENASICQSHFLETHILKSSFRHATLQDNIFRDVFITKSSFIGCNMEYSEFINAKIEDSILPFHQIPYIYGGLQCLKDSNNSIKITSSMENAPILSAKEYFELLPVFIAYYEKECDYFPLANISLFLGNIDAAKEYIHNGLKEYIRKREFRKLKSLCKLAIKNGNFNRHDLSGFYFEITDYFMSTELSPNEQYQFGIHIDEIKNILLNVTQTEKYYVEIILKTDLTIDKEKELIEFIAIIEDCLKYNYIASDEYSLELKHNSPSYSFWLMVSSINPKMLVMLLGMLQTIFSGDTNLLYTAMEVCANAVTIASFIYTLKNSAPKNHSNMIPKNSLNNKAESFALKKHKILKEKNTKVSLSVGTLHFNYETQKNYQ